MKLFDCFMYNNEDLLLELRLNILEKMVYKFIIIESRYDHRGNRKKLKFRLERFELFKDRIIYVVLDEFPKNLSNWERENYNRNFITNGLNEADPDDYIMISDIDEIPKINSKEIFKKKRYTSFRQSMFYYKFNLKNITEPYWFGTRACKKKYLKSPQWLRNKKFKKYPFWRFDKLINFMNWNIIDEGGWHFSFLMNSMDIRKKLLSFAHSEFSSDEFSSLSAIENKINKNKDLFDRNYEYKKVEIDELFPDYILRNKRKFEDFIVS
jgi:beta-1,4-mannosyl-glycoprotein beta-1,4-N-acetylglucosaminyltransferase